MTIRSGGRAREGPQAHPAERGTYEEGWQPDYKPERTGRADGRRADRRRAQRRIERLGQRPAAAASRGS